MTEHSKGALNISRAEVAQYGHGGMPLMVRRLGMTLTNAEQARRVVEEDLNLSREADSITGAQTSASVVPEPRRPNEYDPQGRSRHTIWLDSLYERIYALEQLAGEAFRELSIEAGQRELERRREIDSSPHVPIEPYSSPEGNTVNTLSGDFRIGPITGGETFPGPGS
jgi:hypothetical protein